MLPAAPEPIRSPRACFASRVPSLALLLVLGTSLSACFTPALPPPYREAPNYRVRFADLETITLVPPLVAVYSMSSGDIEQEIQEWSDQANQNSVASVRAQVEQMGKRFVPFAGTHGPRPDFRMGIADDVNSRREPSPAADSWLLFEAAKEAILRHTYDPLVTFPPMMKSFDYTLGREAAALRAGTEADAFLLVIATDEVPTADRQALVGVGAAAALYTGSYAGPGATPAEVIVALVESSSGDILWFNKVSMPIADLRNPESNAALIEKVLKGMNR
jgi:hypothetical protein